MILYYSLTSPYSRKARVCLLEKGAVFEGIDVRATGKSSVEHNPLGKIPTLVLDDGTALFDSTVITEAVDELFPSPKLIPSVGRERMLVRRWESIADGVCDVLIPVIVDRLREPSIQNTTYNEKLVGKAQTSLAFLESNVKGRTVLVGDAFSLADIAVLSTLDYVDLRCPELLAAGLPEIRRYRDVHQNRPSLASTVPPKLPVGT
jgi:glutathione S-transferase